MGWKAIYEGDPTEYDWAEKRFMKEPTEYEWAKKRFIKEPTEYEWAGKRFTKEPTEYEWAEKHFPLLKDINGENVSQCVLRQRM